MKLLATHSTKNNWLLLVFVNANTIPSYIHACTNKAHSITNLQDIIPMYFGSNNYKQNKVGIKCCGFAREFESFMYAWM